ncbi:MAG TPA: 2OG-Fe(II) oxygenase [Oscillatoriaceae cyanobacterium M33_DOE_052]|nr:2OG-Fe(II) oxygenase [Oscillatoriaceae cyanobacterium M33_DOE_052]
MILDDQLPEPGEAEAIYMTVMLQGDHKCELAFPADDLPLMGDLLRQLLAEPGEGENASKLFKLPIDGGRTAMYVPRSSVVGIMTDPPLPLEEILHGQQQPPPLVIESQYVLVDNFLTVKEYQQLLDWVLANQSDLQSPMKLSNTVSSPQWQTTFINRVQAVIPFVLSHLDISSFPLGEITASLLPNPIPNDKGQRTNNIVITFVYYLYREPKSFTGGELRIYDSQVVNNQCVVADSYQVVEPRGNRAVFFFSSYDSMMQPIGSPEQNLISTCFVINGGIEMDS